MPAPPPLHTPVAAPFWEALREGRVVLQQCGDCTNWVFYPRAFCPTCGGTSLAWRTVSGRGTLYSFTLAVAPLDRDMATDGPLLLAIVELAEGVRVATTLVATTLDQVRIGGEVVPIFDSAAIDGTTLLRFTPA